MIIYRQLRPDEWPKLTEYFEKMQPGYRIAPPQAAIAAVAEDENGEIVGALLQQLMWHREPLALNSPKVRFDKLDAILTEAFAPYPGTVYYAFTDRSGVMDMARTVGMEPLKGVLMKGGN
jgi:hypothetical protein